MSNQELIEYVQTQIAQSSNRLSGYTKDPKGLELYKRSVYLVLEKYVKDFLKGTITDPRILIMPGLRGTGKTTLLAQLFLNQLTSGVEKIYISADEVVKRFDIGLWELLEHYEKIIGFRLEELKQPLILFFDEIHYDRKWASFLKSIYDRTKKVMVICTGSAALLLREQMNADIARRALASSLSIRVDTLEQAFDVSNAYAPEHLIVALRDARSWLPLVQAAGSVFLGDWAPEALGDYCSGTNHVLPTSGAARHCSGLSVASFQVAITVQEVQPRGLAAIGPCAVELATAEGLDAHRRAVTLRMEAPA